MNSTEIRYFLFWTFSLLQKCFNGDNKIGKIKTTLFKLVGQTGGRTRGA